MRLRQRDRHLSQTGIGCSKLQYVLVNLGRIRNSNDDNKDVSRNSYLATTFIMIHICVKDNLLYA